MTTPQRSAIYRLGKKMRRRVDAVIARSSRVPNHPVLDARDFEWTADLRANWQAIRDEARGVMVRPEAIPPLDRISPDHRRIAPAGQWRSFFLHGYGCAIDENIARCPRTAAIVGRIPGLNSAFFSILAPGTHIPLHRGVTKGLLTCHLGLQVPAGPCRMQVGDRFVRWAEGETLLFDDTYPHEVWNDTNGTRVVLLVQFARPLRAPGKWIADAFLAGVKRSPFVREARGNLALWEQSLRAIEQDAQAEPDQPRRDIAA